MKINIYALLAATIVLLSLFFPWLSWSFSDLQAPNPPYLVTGFCTYSPFRMVGSMSVYNSTSSLLLASGSSAVNFKPSPYWSIFSPNNAYYVSMLAVSLLLVFVGVLLIHVSFMGNSWSRAGRKIAIVTSNLSFLTIFLCLIFLCYPIGGSALLHQNASFVPFLDIGFWLAILGAGAAYASWLHPTFINLEAKAMVGKFDAFKRWLPVSEWGKILTVLVSSFLPIFIFIILYLPLV